MSAHTVPSHAFRSLAVDGATYDIYLPDHESDYIQGRIMESGEPYEHEMLTAMAAVVAPGDLILDVGANVGNHTVYLAAVAGCRVLAFEPNAHLVEAIRTSVRRNGLAEQVEVFATALGSNTATGYFADLTERVAVIKIEVEGMEQDVLLGAQNLVKRDMPHIFVECQTADEFRNVADWLTSIGYAYENTYNATPTHHFRPVDQAQPGRQIQKTIELVMDRYQLESSVSTVRQEAHRIALRYRNQAAELHEAHRRLEELGSRSRSLVSSVDALKEEVRQAEIASHSADSAFRRVRSEALVYRSARDERNVELQRLRSEKAALLKRIDALQTRLDRAKIRGAKASAAAKARSREVQAIKSSRTYRLARAAGLPLRAFRRSRVLRMLSGSNRNAVAPAAAIMQPVSGDSDSSERASSPSPVAHEPILVPARADRRLDQHELVASAATAARRASRFEARRKMVQSPLRIAAVVDDFTRRSLRHECELLDLRPGSWKTELQEFDADLLFIESAWRGVDGMWHNTVPKCPQDLLDIIGFCREAGIPTVFWNKEDPIHFQTFLEVARQFDHVYTTDVDCVPRYQDALGHNRVHFLPFACQPRLQNPLREDWPRKNALVFAGAYYTRYKERMRDLDELLDGASAVVDVDIFDRNLGTTLDDYRFPDRYDKYIVGTLDPSKISYAYKGYRFALNLNSVKASQSMFARRAYELISSGTVSISNYSRGLKVMLGDILPMTDDAHTTTSNLTNLVEDQVAYARQRLVGLRKAHREHTYRERLRYLCTSILGRDYQAEERIVTVLVAPRSPDEAGRLLSAAQCQAYVSCETVVVSDEPEIRELARSLGASAAIDRMTASTTTVQQLVSPVSAGIAVMNPADWYGAHYLIDIVLATTYSHADVIGKGYPLRAEEATVVGDLEADPYGPCRELTPRRAVVRPAAVADAALLSLLDDDSRPFTGLSLLSVDSFDYCEDGHHASELLEQRWSGCVEFDTGIELAQMLADLDHQSLLPELDGPVISSDAIAATKSRQGIRLTRAPVGVRVTSTLAAGAVKTVKFPGVADAPSDGLLTVAMRTSGDTNVRLAYNCLDAAGDVLERRAEPAETVVTRSLPEGTTRLQFGLRIAGPGQTWIDSIDLAPTRVGPPLIPTRAKVLLLTNIYPSYDNLYRNGFVHARVRAYARHGLNVDVYRLGGFHDTPTYSEFEGVEVLGGNASQLRRLLTEGNYDTILVHFLTPRMWEVVSEFADDHRIVVWVHGAEVQPWWRRAFNFVDPDTLQQAKLASDDRLHFWRSLLNDLPSSVHFVFVSQYFADEVMADLKREIPRSQCSVIHNPVDETIFTYVPKPEAQRTRILSIRPYVNATYANDLSVAAVLALSNETWFSELDFLFVGDGPLFESTLEPLREFANVKIQQGFLTQRDIASLHKEYGIFLVPTRTDTQGVSKDEAMSSGLVPITNDVAAIPEFVSSAEGFLAPLDDHQAMAAAIATMYHDPAEFIRRSAAAARRVRSQTAASIIVPQEVSLIAGAEH